MDVPMNSFLHRVRSAFSQTPWTAGLVIGNLLVWLLAFFSVSAPMEVLGGNLDVAHAWRWLTYPLATGLEPLWFFISLYCFWLFSASLESRWGKLKYGRVFLVVTILCAVSQWVAFAIAQRVLLPTVGISGIFDPATAIFVLWAAIHRDQTVLAMFVIPIQARYLALGIVVITFFSYGPLFGLFKILVPIGCWLWATQNPTGHAASVRRKSISGWWKERRRAKKKSRFQVLEGGSPMASPPRIGSLHALGTGPVKVAEETEKELDRILDKIRFEGMNSLTETEKATLDSQSRRLREES